ncbi:glycosyltransferase family 2 protein [Anabaena sp. UHCC 0399]|uniref:glycosyltransferase family 2 protein n=1 Tax=Anabaena sp. UHCC 0399 TaxID=3110238 RepID=UPI002B1EB3DE|nr:glycosyltransferase [Anabaena sp. UHCC 0399]MEA5567041.1 glycosyltransferase [Anabaena sp. UHCC 0399]
MTKVTVLMPVYNGELYLREAIDSILDQTFQDFEFLIINDGSTDSTREIICSYDDPRIRLIDNDYNLGLTRSLNKGLKLAEGEFIARQDADDISEPERLAKQVAFLETHPEVALVGTWYKDIDPQGSLIGECNLPCNSIQIRWDILFYCPFVHSGIMFRKYTIGKHIGFYNEAFSYAQDYDLWWRIARHLQVANLNEYLIKLRINPCSMTATYGNIVDDEPLQIKCNNIGHLLGWEKAKAWSDGVFFKAMTLLWIGTPDELKDLNLQYLNQTIEEIFKIHQDFCNYYNLDREECKKHRNQVSTQLINQLLELAYYYLEQDKYNTWQLLNRAFCLNFRILLTKKVMRLFLKLIIGSRLVREIQYITQEKLKLEQN